MIRNAFIQRKVLELYRKIGIISYPICLETVFKHIDNCRVMSYEKFAEVTGCTIQDVVVLCESESGATHYDAENERYLVLYNNKMNAGRIRWTLAHEAGHICLGHLTAIGEERIAYTEQRDFYNQLESEADFFAWNLLAPLPILRENGVKSSFEIEQNYGLSAQAAAIQYDRYTKWCRGHIKTAWENDMLNVFRLNQ